MGHSMVSLREELNRRGREGRRERVGCVRGGSLGGKDGAKKGRRG